MKKTSLGTLAFAAPILLAMTWFTFSALYTGRIRIGDGNTPYSEVFTREDQPKDYWRSVGCFLVVTGFCWFGVGFHVYREHRRSKEGTQTVLRSSRSAADLTKRIKTI